MKILIIIDSLGSGGAERSTAVMADFMAKKNVDFVILCLDKKDIGVQQMLLKKGYKIEFVKNKNFFSQINEIAKFINKDEFCVVHSILFRSNLRTRFAKLFVKFTHLESLVNTTYSKERLSDNKVNQNALKFYKIIDRFSANVFVDHFHSITNTVKDHYVEKLRLKESKVSVIYRGRKPLEKETPKIDKNVPKIINVGRHEFQKGQLNLLRAIKILKERNYKFELNIYGREGTSTPELKFYIINNQLDEFVKLCGFSHEIPVKLLKSDIFVFPSLYEGLGGALIEAQSAGLPIACSDIPVLKEVVLENENAKLFNFNDIESIALAIQFFLDNPEKRLSFGQKSLQNFNDKFLESENNLLMLNLYKKLCQSSEK